MLKAAMSEGDVVGKLHAHGSIGPCHPCLVFERRLVKESRHLQFVAVDKPESSLQGHQSLVQRSCPCRMFKPNVVEHDVPHRALARACNFYQLCQCRSHYLGPVHPFAHQGIIIDFSRGIILEPFARFVEHFDGVH